MTTSSSGSSTVPSPAAAPLNDAAQALCVNAIRMLAVDMVQAANSGHPGIAMGAAPMAYALWQHHLQHDPKAPKWPNRDRFVLSAGHGSALLYSLLHLAGYDVTMDDVKNFRQWQSRTPGHPECHMTPGVEATTGPLGQGSANAVGMAMAERALAHRFNRPGHTIVDHMTYALVSDGDLMEGISAEAASLAGHLGLGKLVYLYDANDISLDGPCDLAFTEDVAKRYSSYGWHVQTVGDGDSDVAGMSAAIAAAKANSEQPSIIIIRTTIGFGSPNKAGTAASHGAPLGVDEVTATRAQLAWPGSEPFHVPDSVRENFTQASINRGQAARKAWEQAFAAYSEAHPQLAQAWQQAMDGTLPDNWDADLPTFEPGEKLATRQSGGKVLNALSARVPMLLGGDADLSCSTKTGITGAASFDGQTGAGRNIHYGVREHAMAAVANGMCYHGGIRPYVSTFFVFSDYMRPSSRLAALNDLPVINVWTHDSIGVGEDGPTHQPVEHLAALRALPNFVVLRPCDAEETKQAWCWALSQNKTPVGLVLSRQGLPTVERSQSSHGSSVANGDVAQGAYVLRDVPAGENCDGVIIGTGSEVHLALAAQKQLAGDGVHVRVVSMPSWELFAAQPQDVQDAVLPPNVTLRVAVEAGVTMGWERWVGNQGAVIGLDHFGASAPGGKVMEAFGFTAEAVADKVRALRQAQR